jgi:asparagine synthetase B (glutamine-hydrolysing)
MTVKGGQVSIRGYYTFPFPEEDSRRSTADYVEELHEVFGRAIGRQTREPVRFGAALSGGFDSRIVTATMLRKIKAEHVSAFTYGNDENHDTLLSKCVAGELGLDHHMVTYSLDDFVSGFAPTVWLTEGLINMPEYYYMGKAMRSRVQMGFSGHGADDLTGRYTRRAYIHNARTLEETKKSIFTHYSSRMGVLRIEPERFYSPDYYRLVKGSVVDYFEESVKPFEHYPFPSIQLYHNIRHRMLRDLTRINDVPGFFVRYRHLFYDREILDFWFRVPFRMRLDFKLYRSYLITKYPRLARIRFQGRRIPVHYWGILRPYYTFRTKAGKMAVRYGKQLGQCVPEVIRRDINTTAYRGPLKPLVRLLVLDGNRRHGMFNHDYLEAKLNDHFSSRADNHFLIHKLLTLELFQNLFLEKNVTGYRLGQPLGEIGTAA